MKPKQKSNRANRTGTTTVEAAFVLPVFLFFVFAIIEYGHAQMVLNVLHSACRSGVRMGATEGVTTNDVTNRIEDSIDSVTSSSYATILLKDASVFDGPGPYPDSANDISSLPDMDLSSAEPRQLFMAYVSISYNDIALVPMAFMDGVVLHSQAFMRHE